MSDPYAVLRVAFEDGDETVRQRYLEAVRHVPPDRCPEAFARVHEAYERIKDEESRLEFLLFDPSQGESVEELLGEEQCARPANRVGLASLLRLLNESK